MKQEHLRFLMVTRSLPCHVRGGLEYHVFDLVRGLASEGHEVHLLSTETLASYAKELLSLGVTLHTLASVGTIPPSRYSLPYFRQIGPMIERLNSDHHFDIIHGHEFAFGFWKPSTNIKSRFTCNT